MAASPTAVAKRPAADAALMPPPPPIKKIKRPSSVLDEDDYTDALSDIIARDYFPGLQESRAQQEYLAALDSKDGAWIAEAAHKLRNATARRPSTTPANAQVNNSTSTATTDTPIKPEPGSTPVPGATPTLHQQQASSPPPPPQRLNTANLSLSAFQARYTSEDNASFNDVLDKQNERRRNKHAFLWTADQRIPTKAVVLHRAKQQELTAQHASAVAAAESDGRELVALTSGATDSRPAQPDSWKPSSSSSSQSPANNLMFKPDSVDQDGITTQQEVRERLSKAGPKAIVLENTRFPPLQHFDSDDNSHQQQRVPSSPSLNTDIINSRRNISAAAAAAAASTVSYPGGDTPRVNGYAFVDEDEPPAQPSYRDLLAGGQTAGDETPNPFKLSSARRRELLHHKLVDEANRKKKQQQRGLIGAGVGAGVGGSSQSSTRSGTPAAGNMTPAARKFLENLAKTPTSATRGRVMVKREHSIDSDGGGSNANNLWTPVRTPRRHKVK